MGSMIADKMRTGLADLDYLIRDDVTLIGAKGMIAAETVAFHGSVPSQRNACIAGDLCTGWSDPAAYALEVGASGAPYVYLGYPDGAGQVWHLSIDRSTREYRPQLIENVSVDSISRYLSDHPQLFSPRAVIQTKYRTLDSHLRKSASSQMSFGGLFDLHQEQTEQSLVSLLNESVVAAKTAWESGDLPADADVVIGRVFLRLIAACALIDKGLIAADRGSMREAVAAARKLLPHFMSSAALGRVPNAVRNVLWSRLQGVHLELLTGDILAGTYEKGLVTKAFRREFSVHYTPPSVRWLVWNAVVPFVESWRPEDRIIVDPTCGSGGFLLTAFEGLSWIEQGGLFLSEQGSTFRERIYGIDQDAFACDIARLALILQGQPLANDWRIRNLRFQQWAPERGRRPRLVIGNPPFGREQANVTLLERSLDWLAPGGVVALVMPQGFLSNASCRRARENLASTTVVEGILELPEKTFEAQVSTCVIVARKPGTETPPSSYQIPYASLDRSLNRREQLWRLRIGDASFASARQLSKGAFLSQQFDLCEVWGKVTRAIPAESIFEFHQGVVPRLRGMDTRAEVSVDPRPGFLPFLANAKEYIEPFRVFRIDYLEWAPEKMAQRGRPEWWNAGKVVLGRHATHKLRWRLIPAVDRVGVVYDSRVLGCFSRDDTWSADAIACLLSSSYANAWYASHSRSADITETLLKELPVPFLTEPQRVHLSAIGRTLEHCAEWKARSFASAGDRAAHAVMVRNLLRSMDEVIFTAAGLGPGEVAGIHEYLAEGDRTRPGMPDETPERVISVSKVNGDGKHRLLSTTGLLLSVDDALGLAVLCVDGLDVRRPVLVPLNELPLDVRTPGTIFSAKVTLSAPALTEVALSNIASLLNPYPSYTELSEQFASLGAV